MIQRNIPKATWSRGDEVRLRKIFIVATKIAAVIRANLLIANGLKLAFPPITTVTAGTWIKKPAARLLEHDVNAATNTEQDEAQVAGEAAAKPLAAAEDAETEAYDDGLLQYICEATSVESF